MRRKRKPLPQIPRRLAISYIPFAKGDLLWQPVSSPPPVTADGRQSNQLTFEDREPADFIQLEIPGDGRALSLVGTATGSITPPRQKRSPTTHVRLTRIRLEFSSKHVFDYVLTPQDGGTIQAISRGVEVLPDRAVIESLYRKGLHGQHIKVLNRIVLRDQRPCVNLHATLESFNGLFSTDTNTFRHSEGGVWITAICKGEVKRLDTDSALVRWSHLRTFVTAATDRSDLAEKIGWQLAIEYLLSSGEADDSGLKALVVDAHLSNLEAFSSRSIPLLGEEYLPASWQLIYATSDAGTQEFLPNAMLAGAHGNAKLAERYIRGKSFAELWPPGDATDF